MVWRLFRGRQQKEMHAKQKYEFADIVIL